MLEPEAGSGSVGSGFVAAPAVAARPAFVAVLAATMALAVIIFPTFGALSTFIIDDLSLSRTQFAWLPAGAAMATAVCALPGGRLADRWGGRRAVIGLLGTTGVMAVGLAVSPSYVLVVALALVAGVPNALANPATNRVIADHVPTGSRGIVIGVKQSGVQAGILVAGLGLPVVAATFGWRAAFGVVGALAAAVALLAYRYLPPDPAAASPMTPTPAFRAGPEQRALGVYALCMGTGGAAVTAFLPLYAVERLDFAPTAAGATVAVVGGVGMLSRIVLGRAVERRTLSFPTTLLALALGAVVTIAGVLVAPRVGAWFLWVTAACAGVTVMAWNAVANLAAVTSVDPVLAGRASAVVNLGFMSGLAIGPLLFGAIVDATTSYALAWAASAASYLAGAVVASRWRVHERSAAVLT